MRRYKPLRSHEWPCLNGDSIWGSWKRKTQRIMHKQLYSFSRCEYISSLCRRRGSIRAGEIIQPDGRNRRGLCSSGLSCEKISWWQDTRSGAPSITNHPSHAGITPFPKTQRLRISKITSHFIRTRSSSTSGRMAWPGRSPSLCSRRGCLSGSMYQGKYTANVRELKSGTVL